MSLRTRLLCTFLSLYFVLFSVLVAPDLAANKLSSINVTIPSAAVNTQPLALIENAPSTITDVTGAFHFTGLKRGTHQIYLDPSSLPADLRPLAGADQIVLWLNPGQSLVSDPIGAGVRLSASYDQAGTTINGIVFFDQDNDGQRSLAESGLAGITIVDPTIHQYFVPFYDDDLWTLFAEIYDDDPTIGQCLQFDTISTTLKSFISVTSSSDGTVYYYDHWEDDYDANPLVPASSTEVGKLDAGVTQTFNDDVTIPLTVTPPFLYDGRDRITILGESASVIRAVYPGYPGEILAGAWEVPEVSNWGQSFVTVIGEDLDFNGAGVANDFDYVGLQIAAAQPDTQIWVNGALVTTTVSAGATFLIDGENDGPGSGGVDSGDTITATGPIQVQMLGAACDLPVSARAYTLQPVDKWDNDYWAPVSDFTDTGSSPWCPIDRDGDTNDDRDTDIYVHNPHPYPITVTFNDGVGPSIPLAVAANTTISVLDILNGPPFNRDLNNVMGAHLYSSEAFWGVSTIDSTSGNSMGGSSGQVHDWGYGLVPVNQLSSQIILGWAPGNSLVPPTSNPAENNGSLAFVSALTDTLIYVDFTQDGLPDAFDMNGDGDADDYDVHFNFDFDEPTSDDGVSLAAGEVLRVADPDDNDLTGATIYSGDLAHKIAVAWGQDPCSANRAYPYLDLGYTVLPYPIPSLAKESVVAAAHADLCGDTSTRDTITYELVLHNNGTSPIIDGVLSDTVPFTYTDFVVGSLGITQPPMPGNIDYLGPAGWGYPPVADADGVDANVRAFRVNWSAIQSSLTITITYSVKLQTGIPYSVDEISNQAVFRSDATGITVSRNPTDPLDPDTDVPIERPSLQITKLSDPVTVAAGDLVTYTIVATNTGDGPALDAIFVEQLPTDVTYQPNTLNTTVPSVTVQITSTTVPYTTTFTGTYADDFDDDLGGDTGYTGDDGSLNWSGNWTEAADDAATYTGEVFVGTTPVNALSTPGYLELTDNASDGDDAGVQRQVDLTDFVQPILSFFVQGTGTGGADDTYFVNVNGVTELTEDYLGPYQQRIIDLSAYVGAIATIQFLANDGLEPADTYRFDNIVIYEASPLRSGTDEVSETSTTVTYTTQSGVNPVDQDLATNVLTLTNPIEIPADTQASFSFQVRVNGAPPPSTTTLTNTVTIVSSSPLPLACDLSANAMTTVIPPTAIDLLYLRANPKASGVLVEWATLFEIDTYGFWLYRGVDPDLNHAEPVAFVPSKGWFNLGASYQYLDKDLPSGLYYYWLVEVENDGDRSTYGPVDAWSGQSGADLPYQVYLPLVSQK